MSKHNNTTQKHHFGDRKDAWLLRNQDSMHILMPFMYPKKCDNEAFIRETIDLTEVLKYIDKKNQNNPLPELPYKVFQVIVAAFVKTVTLRPNMNRFIQGQRMWQRKELSAAFIVKKQFSDTAKEGIAYICFPPDSTMDYVHSEFHRVIFPIKQGKNDDISNAMDILTKFPHWFVRIFMNILGWLDTHGKVPASLMKGDPSYATLFLTNLGSIKLNAGYHHLSERGSNSIFITVGEMQQKPFYDDTGNVQMRTTLDIGITLDERIGDGYYFSRTIKLLKYLLANPDLLDLPANQEVDYDNK